MEHTTPALARAELQERGTRFRDLHRAGSFVLANAWDAASAAVMELAGAPAIGTTSSGISWALGVPDGEHLSRRQAVQATATIADAVDVPVTADVEAGYGSSPQDVAATIEAVAAAGAVGANLEDRRWPGKNSLWPADQQAERIAAARAAADRTGLTFTLNARTDVFLAGIGEPGQREDAVLERAALYAEAGADCLFVPGLTDLTVIAAIASASPLPVNVLLAPGCGPGISELASAGVRRISTGHVIAAAALAAVQHAAQLLLEGDDGPLRAGIPHPQLQQLLAHRPGVPA
jgi:2-methylisocitrate lyase-like PEP mutase family enzyme